MINVELKSAIERAWISRAVEQGLKHGSAAFKRAQLEFFAGAMSAINAMAPNTANPELLSEQIPPGWMLKLMVGRDVVSKADIIAAGGK